MVTISHEDKVLYALSALAGAEDDTKGPNLGTALLAKIKAGLATARPNIGGWDVAWGPAVLQVPRDGLIANAMYVAHSLDSPSRYVVAIAGTDPMSIFDWLVEDFIVSIQVPWIFAPRSAPDAKISLGTAIGLGVLLTLEPTASTPGAGIRVLDFLGGVVGRTIGAPIELATTGHSLGGALSATMALLLHDTQGVPLGWDPEKRAKISSMPTAGPTAGNRAFARHSDQAIGKVMRRLSNSIDVIPHAWNEASLARIPGLYAPTIPATSIIEALIARAAKAAQSGDYIQPNVDTPPLPGTVDKSILHWYEPAVMKFVVELAYQHTIAYQTFFGFDSKQPPNLAALKATVTPEKVARALTRTGLTLPPELASFAQTAGGPRQIAVGQEWITAPSGPNDPRVPDIVQKLTTILASAARVTAAK